jgi:hypothetical protein
MLHETPASVSRIARLSRADFMVAPEPTAEGLSHDVRDLGRIRSGSVSCGLTWMGRNGLR